jgi:hypothetical protein
MAALPWRTRTRLTVAMDIRSRRTGSGRNFTTQAPNQVWLADLT